MISKSKIKEIIDLLDGTDITEIEISSDKDIDTIRIARYQTSNNPGHVNYPVDGRQIIRNEPGYREMEQTAAAPGSEDKGKKLLEVKAPLVGSYYSSPKPDEPPFVNIGDIIKVGQTVCIIEAMKIFNEIESEVTGRVVETLLNNEDPVEYGQTMMILEPV